MDKKALVVGVTGITGNNLARHLLERGDFEVTGLSRHGAGELPGVRPISVDLHDAAATHAALAGSSFTHLFYGTWTRCATEAENCRVNGAMLAHVLGGLKGSGLRHACLITGLKHYLGPFESYGKVKPDTPFEETQPRLPYENFYYTQEDILHEAAAKHDFTWTVHRPHTLIGFAIRNGMNMGATLAVYASICKATGRPFLFPGSPQQWDGVIDVTDARLLARHCVWSSTTPAAMYQGLNTVNGDVFRWRRLWGRIATWFKLELAPYPGHATPLELQMAGAAPLWDRLVVEHGLRPNRIEEVASWWHSDADLAREIECFTSMAKSRKLGFLAVQDTETSFFELFARLRAERVIP